MTVQDQIRAWHRAMGLDFPFPDLAAGSFAVLETDPAGALAVKRIGEAYLWLDPDAAPLARSRALVRLDAQARAACVASGIEEVSAWIPPAIVGTFERVLRHLGWRPSRWQSWSVRL